MKKLIINADDFGLCESVNKGIIECLNDGLVTDLSFMVNLDEFDKSHQVLSALNIKNIGIHLNLTVGKSLLSSKTKFTDRYGNYFNLKTVFRKLLFREIPKNEIYDEIITQINFIRDHGYNITHIDSHTNIHLLPKIMENLLLINKELDLNVPIRMPYETRTTLFSVTIPNFIRIKILNFLTRYCGIRTRYKTRIRTIGGNFFNNPKSEVVFKKVLSDIRLSSFEFFEIAVHPGYPSDNIKLYDSYFNQREWELNFLRNNKILEDRNGIQLCNFKEVNK